MNLSDYYSISNNHFQFTRLQASRFAKNIAGDFNPIHDQDHKRFCVPGDLLFALVLKQYGISEQMKFEFGGMVSDKVLLQFKDMEDEQIDICDEKSKVYLTVERSGNFTKRAELVSKLLRAYVGFSGQTFPHVLVPLMKEHDVMINPDRPLVIYNSMLLDIHDLTIKAPSLELVNSTLTVDGKRGNVCLNFNFIEAGKVVGRGEKNMLLSSLRSYDSDKIAELVKIYNHRKETITE